MTQRPDKAAGARTAKAMGAGGHPPAGAAAPVRTKVFISYSHKDRVFLDRLLVHLSALERTALTEVWVDTRIKSGEKWRDELVEALRVTKVAILLVSIDYITSDFISKNELPPLLKASKKDGVLVIPVLVRPCENRFRRTPSLNQFQAENIPEKPLSEMKYGQREAFWDRLAGRIQDFLSESAP